MERGFYRVYPNIRVAALSLLSTQAKPVPASCAGFILIVLGTQP